MATLTSSSTLAEVQDAYDDNASYAEDESVGKAAAFMTAVRILLRRMPKRQVFGGRGGQELESEMGLLRAELEDARRWVASHSGGAANGQATYFGSSTDFRE